MSRTHKNVIMEIREKQKALQAHRSHRENTPERKRNTLTIRLKHANQTGEFKASKGSVGMWAKRVQRIADMVVTNDVHEASPGVYVVNVNSSDPTGEDYFNNSGRLERMRELAAKK